MDSPSVKTPTHSCRLKGAIKFRGIKTITDLLNNNPDIKPNQLDDHKLIHQVVHYSNGNHELQASVIEVLRLLLDFGVNVNVKNDEDCTVLHLAIDNRMRKVIDFLISRNADLHVCDKSGNSILHFLIKREIIRVERSLSSSKLSLNEDSIAFRELEELRKESADFIKWMILKGLDVDHQNNDGDTMLHYLLKNQRKYFAKVILEHSKNVDKPNGDGNTPLNIILDCGKDILYQHTIEDEKIMLGLLEKGADIHKLNVYGTSPAINAVMNRNLSILQLFKKKGVDFRQSDNVGNLLHSFFKSKITKNVQIQESVFDLLIDEGCDVNGTDDEGRTPLHFAARGSNLHIVERLIECGANVNSQEFTLGYAPLHEAVEQSRDKIATMLMENGANVNIKSKKGKTPLFLINGNFEEMPRYVKRLRRRIRLDPREGYITRKLMKYGAEIDVRDVDGYLPLQAAILRGDYKLMRELLRYGGDINDNTQVMTGRDYQLLEEDIGEHVIKLQVADLPVDDKLKYLPIIIDEYHELTRADSVAEVKDMKSYMITERMSLYDFLHLKLNIICIYVKNEKLMELISSADFNSLFPRQFRKYRDVILSTYNMAVARQKLLEPGKSAWLQLTGIRLPDLCLYEIFNYVSNVTLRIMIEGSGLVL